MSSSERAAELRALADQHDTLGTLEDDHQAAVEAYRANPSEESRAAYTEASEALREARRSIRSSGLMIAENTPGSTTIGAAGIAATSKES